MKALVCAVTVIAICEMQLGVAVAAFKTPLCLAKKRTAWGNLRKCQATEEAKQLLGKTPDLTKCQTKFTDAVAKVDAKASASAIACRYGDHGDGTVIDYDTGLQWEKKTHLSPLDICTRLEEHCVISSYSWDDAVAYVNGTGMSLSIDSVAPTGVFAGFAGHSDWRLPTVFELRGILDVNLAGCGFTSPCIDPILGPTRGIYWSATTDTSNPALAFTVDFLDDHGFLISIFKSEIQYVRAVRSAL